MSYFAVCTFELKNASNDDYKNIYADLAKIGFSKQITSTQGNKITLPSTTTAGDFNGTSEGAVRDDLIERVKKAFEVRRFKSEIFITIGGDSTWGYRTT